jgi:acyl-ACP thioesterase
MTSVHKESFTISQLHTDCHGKCKPSVLLYFAQEVAGNHCQNLVPNQPKRLFWALSRNKVQFTRIPTLGETITLETWPLPATRVAYPRSTIAYDEMGNEVFRAISLWVLMDKESRAMVLPNKSGVDVPGILRGNELTVPHSILPVPLQNQLRRKVCYTDLDQNKHMNNTRYLDWVEDLLPSAFFGVHSLKELTLCYLNEALEGQTLSLNWELLDGPCLQVEALRPVENMKEKSERVFSCQLIF